MDNEREVRLVVTHAQRGGRYKGLNLIFLQRLLQLLTPVTCLTCVGLYSKAPGLEPIRQLIGISDSECVNDAVPWK